MQRLIPAGLAAALAVATMQFAVPAPANAQFMLQPERIHHHRFYRGYGYVNPGYTYVNPGYTYANPGYTYGYGRRSYGQFRTFQRGFRR